MRPKKTYIDKGKIRRRPQYLVYWEGEHAKASDADLPPELAEIVLEARVSYAIKGTPAENIKETLRGLIFMKDDAQIRHAVTVMDNWTEAYLGTAAGKAWRQENPDQETPVPDDLFNVKTWIPDHIRQMASYALKIQKSTKRPLLPWEILEALPKKNGRRPTKNRDVVFASELAKWWQKETGEHPTITIGNDVSESSSFVKFSQEMFHQTGRFVAASSLKKILQLGCEISNHSKS